MRLNYTRMYKIVNSMYVNLGQQYDHFVSADMFLDESNISYDFFCNISPLRNFLRWEPEFVDI